MALTQVSTGGIKDGQVHTADLADAQITAGKLHADALDHTYTLGASGTDHYTFTGEGLTGAVNDPTLYLTRGKTYRFVNGNSSGAHPFRIQSVAGAGGTEYNTGVTNNAGGGGSTIIFEVPHDAPDVLYYICTSHANMNGIFYVTGALADGTVTTAKLADDAVTDAKIANSINTAIAANTAKTTNATHTGDVTGSTSLTIAADAVTTAKIADDAVTADKLANSINTAIAANTAKDLTALSASNLTSGTVPDARFPATLPAVSGANLTGISSAGVARNLIINGAMQVAQRGTSSTTSGYQTVDRFALDHSGTDEAPTQEQVDVASGTSPYAEGFRKAFKITNGNQTTAAGTDYMGFRQTIEAQNLANSGWDYNSTSSFVTLSFWIKSSVAQSFEFNLRTEDGTNYIYLMSTGSLSANTWTKITKTIPGTPNLTIHNDTGVGAQIYLLPFAGTTYTNNPDTTHNAWQVYNSNWLFGKDSATTWWYTNDATLEITGVQLELGQTATDFSHESYGDTLAKCQRYYYVHCSDSYENIGIGMQYYSGNIFIAHGFPTTMRVEPTMQALSGSSGAYVYERLFSNSATYYHTISYDTAKTGHNQAIVILYGEASRAGQAVRCSVHWFASNTHKFLAYDAEL